MADLPDLSKEGGHMIESIKEIAPFVGVIVAAIAGWWAWRTSLLKAVVDRLAAVETREELRIKEAALAQLRVAELTAELMLERGGRKAAEQSAAYWHDMWRARRDRQRQDSQHPASPAGDGLAEDTSDADALDAAEAADRSDTSGLIRVPPGGMPK